ncbi:hypothetical protein AKO1_002950, partial [Acrasis kona]
MQVNDMVVTVTPLVSSSTTAVNPSLIKMSTLVHTILGLALTGVVVIASVGTVALIVASAIDKMSATQDYVTNYKHKTFYVYPLANDATST